MNCKKINRINNTLFTSNHSLTLFSANNKLLCTISTYCLQNTKKPERILFLNWYIFCIFSFMAWAFQMKMDSVSRTSLTVPEAEMDSQEGYYLQFPNRIWKFRPDFCPNRWKYGILGICSFFRPKKTLWLRHVEAQWFLVEMFFCRASQESHLCTILGQNFIRSSLAVLDSRNLIKREIYVLKNTFRRESYVGFKSL